MSEEYKPTEEETKRIENTLSPKQSVESRVREKELEKLRTESDLDDEMFDEISRSIKFDRFNNDANLEVSFSVRKHKVKLRFLGQVKNWATNKDRVSLTVDDNFVTNQDKIEKFYIKYSKILIGLEALDNTTLDKIANDESIDDLLLQ